MGQEERGGGPRPPPAVWMGQKERRADHVRSVYLAVYEAPQLCSALRIAPSRRHPLVIFDPDSAAEWILPRTFSLMPRPVRVRAVGRSRGLASRSGTFRRTATMR